MEKFVCLILPLVLIFGSLAICVIHICSKVYLRVKAEKNFINYLKNDDNYQSNSLTKPTISTWGYYYDLYEEVLNKMFIKSLLTSREYYLIKEGFNSLSGSMGFISNLWERSKEKITCQ
jgi:hypothetical protein